MEEHLPGIQLQTQELVALILSIVTFVHTRGVQWLHGWQPRGAARWADGPARAAPRLPGGRSHGASS